MAHTALRAPAISRAELESFHNAHFGQPSVNHFSTNFLPPHDAWHVEQPGHFHQREVVHEEYEQEDDGLGYYEDGVKRTLTDEQIAMFRHSELEALRRAREAGDSKPATSCGTAASTKMAATNKTRPTESAEPGEVPSEDDIAFETVTVPGKKKKRRRAKARAEPEKPDLRKRTWDLVDTGLESLDYGDEPRDSSSIPRPIQRRHISYED